MKFPPMWVHVKIHNSKHDFGFWVPLFLFLLIKFVFFLALLPLIIISVLILWPSGWGKRIVMFIKAVYEIICSLHGLKLDVQGHKENVHISIV